jgi:hypothetical protein
MSRFDFDNAAQRRVRDLVLGPGFYGPHSQDGRYVYVDKGRLATILQKRFAVDTIMQRINGDAACVEEKIVRDEYAALSLETMSCTVPGHESEGWMRYGQADLLNWAMCRADGKVMIHLFDFPKLQEVFWPAVDKFKEGFTKQHNRTAYRKVPITWIKAQGVGHYSKLIHPTPEGCEAVLAYRLTHYRRTAAPDPIPSAAPLDAPSFTEQLLAVLREGR